MFDAFDVPYFAGALETVIRFWRVVSAAPQIFANSANFGFDINTGRYSLRACISATGTPCSQV